MTPISLTRGDLVSVVTAATKAPSMHNTQPWLFRIDANGVRIYADNTRRLPVADPTGTALRISCGAAILNLRLAFAQLGHPADVHLLPDPRTPDLLAELTPGPPRPPTPTETALHAAIPRRHSNRQPFLTTAVPADLRAELTAAANTEGCWFDLILGPAGLDMVTHMVAAADRILLTNNAYRAELTTWTRTDDTTPDGVPHHAGGPAPQPQDLLARRDFGGPPTRRNFETDPLVGVLGTISDSARDELNAGQALQRILLTATRHGLVSSMMSQAIEVPQVREQLRLGLRRTGAPQMLLRLGYGEPGSPTPRRPLNDVLLNNDVTAAEPVLHV